MVKYNAEHISDLIDQLKRLKVVESHILHELEESHNEATASRVSSPTAAPESAPAPAAATPYLASSRSPVAIAAPESTTTPPTTNFEIGDKVVITNKIKPRSNRHVVNEKDRIAIVTRVTDERVFFRTLNGNQTWRAPHNLRLFGAYARTVQEHEEQVRVRALQQQQERDRGQARLRTLRTPP
jgi:hypothetical protein